MRTCQPAISEWAGGDTAVVLPLRVRAQLPLLRACPHLQPPVHLAGMYLISVSTNRH